MSKFGHRAFRRIWEFEELEPREMPSGSATPLSSSSASSQMHTNFVVFGPANSLEPDATASPSGTTPSAMVTAYGVNEAMFGTVVGNGAGQTIAIVDAYNQPNIVSNLASFDSYYGLAAPPSFTVLNETGGTALPGDDSKGGWGVEISLDVEWAHVIAPDANIILFEANSSSSSDLYTTVDTARNYAGVSVISMSWSGGETSNETSTDSTFTTPSGHTGVTFLAATGDDGAYVSATTLGVGYPAISPNVVAVGGTTLTTSGGTYVSESGWGNGTSSYSEGGSGGGISKYESQPSYQTGVVTQSTTNRTIPDVSMDANPSSGVPVYDTYDFSTADPWEQIGGTSLATPLFAGVIAIADQGYALYHNGATLDGPSQTLPDLYALAAKSTSYANDFHDITSGNNGYAAGTGYDLVTGIGSPIVNTLVAALSSPPSDVYADTRWAGLANGTVITDADPVASGNQSAIIGTTAFASVNAAIAAAVAGGYTTVIVNGDDSSGLYGTFNQAVDVNAAIKLVIQYGPVTFNSLTDSSSASTITLSGVNLTVGSDNTSTTVDGAIGGTGSLTKVGSGAMTLSDTDTYSGATTVSGGTLIAGTATAFSSASAFTVGSGATLTLNGFSETIGSLAGSGTVQDASSTSATLTVGGAASTVFSGLLQNGTGSGSLGLTATGTGTLTLSGTNNSYTGVTKIVGGILSVASLANGAANSSIGASSSAATSVVLAGGALQYTGGTTSTNRSFTLSAASTLGVNTSGTTLIIGGTETGAFVLTTTGPGNLVFSTSGALNNVGGITVSSGNLQVSGQTLTASRKLTIAAGSTVTTTGTLLLSPTNSAETLVSGAGTLQLGSTTSSTTSPDISYASAVGFDFTVTVASAVNLGNSMRFIETFSNENPFTSYNGDLVFSGAISAAASSGLTFFGTSNGAYLPVTVLAGANTGFLGSVTINSGELVLNNSAALSNANSLTLDPASGATTVVYLDGHAINIGSLSSAGAAGTVEIRNGSNTAGSLTVTQTTNATFGGVISDGPNDAGTTTTGKLSLVLAAGSNSILALSAVNTYSGGTTINGGTLQANTTSGSGTGTGNVTVNSGGTSAGTGDVASGSADTVSIAGGTLAGTLTVGGPISVTAGGTISPGGAAATGIINAANVTFASGTVYAVTLNGTTAGTGYDQIDSTGLVNLNNATLNLSAGFTASPGNTFDIITDASQAVVGTFNGLAQGATITVGSQSFSISYVGGASGHDVVLTALATAPPPTVTGISPTSGSVAGGTSVTITGANFTGVTAVDFGSAAATNFTFNSDTSITAVAPTGTDTVDVTVTTPAGVSATSPSDQFTYSATVTGISPTSGLASGGASVTITGVSFTNVSAVDFGGTPALSFTFNSDTSITAVAPAGTDTVDVTVTTPDGGVSATSPSDQFTYAPTVTGISPNSGSSGGGDSVTITGVSFTNVSAVDFGGTPAMSFTFNSDTSITAIAPAGTGTVDITVATPNGGVSATSPADQFNYVSDADAGTTITSNPVGPLTQGEPVTFTATIAGNPSVGAVSFYLGSVDPANEIGSAVNVSGGSALSISTTSLPVGNDTIIAVYSGGTGFAGSQGTLSVTVNYLAPAVTSFTVNGSGTAAGAASASESADGTTATITAPGLNFLGFYPGELVNVSGFTNQTGFNGTYTITATSGNSFSYADSLPASVTDTGGTAYPALEETNAGTLQVGQASMVDSLVVVFNEAVTISSPSTAFSLALKSFTDNNVANSLVGDATTTVTATNPSGDGMTWVLQFSGGTTAPVIGGSISDGDYYLNLAAGSVAAAASPSATNASYQNSFYRLFGDINGNGQVTSSAYKVFSQAYGVVSINSPAYNAAFDFDGNGQITSAAYKAFSQRYGFIWTNL